MLKTDAVHVTYRPYRTGKKEGGNFWVDFVVLLTLSYRAQKERVRQTGRETDRGTGRQTDR